MIEIGLAIWIVAIGAVATAPVATARMPLVYAVVIVPSGYAVYVIAALALTIADGFSPLRAMVLASAVAMTGAIAWALRARPTLPWGRAGVEAACVGAAAALVAAVAQVIHVTRMTLDSLTYLVAAGGLDRAGGLGAYDASAVLKRLLVVPALEAPGALTGRGYVASVMPLFGVAALALTARLAHEALGIVGTPRRRAAGLLVAGAVFLLTTNRVVFHIAYLHTHMVFATFLLLGVGMAWLALQHERWQLLVPAALGFAALPMLRAEAWIVALIFLVPVVTEGNIPARGRWALAAAPAATTIAWFAVAVPPHVRAGDLALTGPVYSNVVGAGALLLLVAATHVRRLRRLTTAAPIAVIAALAVFVGIGAVREPELLRTSVAATAANLAAAGGWGTYWMIVIALFVLAAVTVRVPGRRLYTYPVVGYAFALFAFVFLRDGGYREGTGDSGNRMMMHIALVVLVYLIAAAGAIAAEAERESQPDTSAALSVRSTSG